MTSDPHNEINRRIAGLSAEQRRAFEAALKARGLDAALPLAARPRGPGGAPLAFGQERLWFLYLWDRESAAYKIPAAIRLKGRLDEAALAKSLAAIVQRHEILRTTFAVRDNRIFQTPSMEPVIPMPRDDFRALAAAERMPAAMRQAAEEINVPFNLETGPVIRARLMRMDDDEWLLVITAHHIVFDGWSTGIFIRELSALYQGFTQGAAPALPEPALQYADYAAWQRDWLSGPALKRLADYWTRKLDNAPPLLQLYTDRPRPATRTNRGDVVRFEFSPEETAGLRQLARGAGVSLFMALVAGFAGLLHRWSGQTDIVIGSPVANRNRREIEPLIGFFVNTLALRVNLDGDPSFAELLGRVRATALEAYDHQDMPFGKLVEILKPDRSMSHPPIFQVMVALQNMPMQPLELPALTVTPVDLDTASAKFDLCLSVEESESGLRGILEYSTDIFARQTIARLAESLRVLLAAAAGNPSGRLSGLPVMTDRERARMTAIGLGTSDARPAGEPVHRMFEQQAARTPDAPALLCDAAAVSFAGLNAEANRLARALRAAGAGPDQAIGLLLPRSAAMVSAMLAVLKSGAAFVPLDPATHANRLAFLLSDARIRILVSDEATLRAIPESADGGHVPLGASSRGIRTILLDRDSSMLARQPDSNPGHGVLPGNCAYVIYTSGSTGRPKGVMVEHGRLAAHCLDMRALYKLTPSDRELLFSSFCFDAALEQVFPIMTAGGASVLRGKTLWTPRETLQRCAASGVTILHTIPAYLQQVLQEAIAQDAAALPGPDKKLRLRLLIAGGDAVAPELVRLWREGPLAGCRLLNEYGPTETTITATVHDFSRKPEAGDSAVPIGRPRPHASAFIVDERMTPAPEGVPGELLVGGDCLARGYLADPKLTAGRFVPDPFSGASGSRLYRTGDRARWLAGGLLEFLGRFDSQVKIRGFRIEPGEIESVLSEHPAVRQAAAVARPGPGNEKRLAAYASLHPDQKAVSADALRAFLQDRLPDYMVPATVVLLEALPLTSSGKPDRHALPEPGLPTPAAPAAAPRIPSRELMARIWGGLLDLAAIDGAGNFFELGGHSLLATQMVSRVREAFGVDIPLKIIFEHPTLEAFTARVEALARLGRPVMPPVTRQHGGPEYPLSFAQQRLWILNQIEPDEPIHIISEAVRLCGRLDAPALSRSLEEIVRRHGVLRSVFDERDGEPLQRIRPRAKITLQLEDLERHPAPERERRLAEILAGQNRQPFDFSGGLLLRAALVRMAEDEHVLALAAHHIAFDGWSVGILIHELNRLYNAASAGRPAQLPEPAIQYADYAAWQRRLYDEAALDDHLSFWKRQLSGIPALLELPADRPRPAIQSYAGATATFAIEPALIERLNRLGATTDATPFMILFASFAALLHRYTGSEDIVVGTPAANRNRTEIEGLIGCFLNILALRADLAGDPAFRALVGRVRHMTLEAFANQEMPFEKLVEELHPERSLSHTPLFQVMFVLQNAPAVAPDMEGLEITPLETGLPTAMFDLILSIRESAGGGLRGVLNYSTDIFDAPTIRQMLRHYTTLLEAAADDPGQRLGDIALADAAERRRILAEWSRSGPAEYAGPVHCQFEERARRQPGAVAVECGSRRIVYGVLESRTRTLAAALRDAGAGDGALVAICAERSPDAVLAAVATLRAGAAYVPLDPALPEARLARMLADSRPAAILAQPQYSQKIRGLLDAAAGGAAARPAMLLLDAEQPGGGAPSARALSSDTAPERLAYVIYTSGSTGTPKGVMVPHRAIAALVAAKIKAFKLEPGCRVLQFVSFGFDVATSDLWMTLCSGATLCMADGEAAAGGEALAAMLRERGITHAPVPAAVLAALPRVALPALRIVMIGGEPCAADAVAFWAQGRALFNEYGPTETTVCSTMTDRVEDGGKIAIGRPIAGTRVYVLDHFGALAPAGMSGELHIGGAGVARGYLNDRVMTADRFIPDPFSEAQGARMYRTGDRARFRPDGSLEFLGRMDRQVKIRGFRIEPGDIEHALAGHPDVGECAVTVLDGASGDKRLAAYVAFKSGAGRATAAQLREHLKRDLPDYMVPAAITVLERLPRTATGKLDRAALPAPEFEASAAYVPPRDGLELELARIWEELLKRPGPGMRDNFFELGGHSLLAAQLMARIHRRFSRDLPLATLFDAPTIEHLAALLRRDAPPAWASLTPIRTRGARPPLFAMPGAGGNVIYFYELARQLGEDQPFYALQAAGLDGETAPHASVGEMAEHYASEIRKVRPEGPWFLCGHSFGAWVGYETARALAADTPGAARLLVLDMVAPILDLPLEADDRTDADWVAELAGVIGRMTGARLDLPLESLRALDTPAMIALLAKRLNAAHSELPGFGEKQLRGFLNVFKANQRMRYRVEQAGPMDVAVFRAADGGGNAARAGGAAAAWADLKQTPDMGWQRVSHGPVTVCRAPGDHISMMRLPHVRELAAGIQDMLKAAQPGDPFRKSISVGG